MKTDISHIGRPKIPGEVFKEKPGRRLVGLLSFGLISFLGYFAFLQEGLSWLFVLYAFIIILAFYEFFIKQKVTSVYITPSTVKATYRNKRKLQKNLKDYFLYVEDYQRGGGGVSSNYCYRVSLLPRDRIHFSTIREGERYMMSPKKLSKTHLVGHDALTCEDNLSAFIENPPSNIDGKNIPLVSEIMRPEDLREWVDAFQEQIETPLPLIYSSMDVQQDYETGIYKSRKKQLV